MTSARWQPASRVAVTQSRQFTLNGTGHATRREQGRMIRCYTGWRSRHIAGLRPRGIIKRAMWPDTALVTW